MNAVILAAYSGAALITLMITCLGTSIAYRCYNLRQFDYTFRIALALTIKNLFISCFSTWRAAYTFRKMHGEPSTRMLDHWAIPVFISGIVVGSLIIIKALTDDGPYDRIVTLCTASVLFIMGLILVWYGV